MKKRVFFMLMISACILNGCVHEEKDIFDEPAAIRMQNAIKEYTDVLTSAQNGWFTDYYPENNYAIGGYAMYLKFTPDGKVTVGCEIPTNAPAGELRTSDWEIFAEQGPILCFSTYNPVMHYFSEPYSSDVDGRAGDYEFVIEKVTPDRIDMKGKKRGNKLILRKNTDNIDPSQYFSEVTATEDVLSEFGMFGFVLNNERIGVTSVVDRTLNIGYTDGGASKTLKVAYTFTPNGIRFALPFEFMGVSMESFEWKAQDEKYVCADAGINAYFDVYFPPDYEIRYGEFFGTWEISFHGASTTTFVTAMGTIEEKKKNATFQFICDELFDFPGFEISFDAQKGIISILNQNAAIDEETGYFIRLCSYDRAAGYLSTASTGPVGIVGVWNKDEGGVRKISFVDNGRWGTYKANGFLLRYYDAANVSMGNVTTAKADYRFNDITITQIN